MKKSNDPLFGYRSKTVDVLALFRSSPHTDSVATEYAKMDIGSTQDAVESNGSVVQSVLKHDVSYMALSILNKRAHPWSMEEPLSCFPRLRGMVESLKTPKTWQVIMARSGLSLSRPSSCDSRELPLGEYAPLKYVPNLPQ